MGILGSEDKASLFTSVIVSQGHSGGECREDSVGYASVDIDAKPRRSVGFKKLVPMDKLHQKRRFPRRVGLRLLCIHLEGCIGQTGGTLSFERSVSIGRRARKSARLIPAPTLRLDYLYRADDQTSSPNHSRNSAKWYVKVYNLLE